MSRRTQYVLWLCSLPGLGNATLYRLFAESGEDPDFAEKLYAAAGREDSENISDDAANMQNGLFGMPETGQTRSARKAQKVADLLRRGRKDCSPEQLEKNLQEKRIHFVWAGDAEFPDRLRNISDPPFALYYRGRLPKAEGTSVGIVGARLASPYGREQARNFAVELAAGGIQIISGMAHGVDGIAGRGALEVSDDSFAVLGCGVDICYPKENRDLYEALCKRGGVISEYRPGTEPEARLFPPRNRIISALSDVILVVEARERSGTLITVDCALEQGKDVFAVPGRICDARSTGCNELIRQGAGIVVSPKAFLEELTGVPSESRRQSPRLVKQSVRAREKMEDPEEKLPILPELESCILRTLDTSTAKSVDEILPEVNERMRKSCTFPVVLRAMMKLSAAGYVREIRVGKYISS